jgi:hypothetical protein
MNASNLAQQILTDMWELGRVVLITAVGTATWGVFLRRFEDKNEQQSFQVGLLLITLGVVGGFALLVFLNVQSGNIVALMQLKPAWGLFTGLVASLVFLFIAMTAYKLLAANRREWPLSIRETTRAPRQLYPRDTKLILSVLSLLTTASILWLWRMAH